MNSRQTDANRGRRCIDAARTECGGWSALTSSAVQVTRSAPPPTALALTLSGDNDLELTYTQSSWTGQTTHFYEFELLRSETSSGTYGEYKDDDDRASPLDFDDVHTGYYYRARGRRCASAGTSCGGWSTLSPMLNVPAKTTYTAPTLSTPTVSGDTDDMTAAFSKSTVASLDSHHYAFELHRADSATGTFSRSKTASATSSPVKFEDIDRSKVYKARGKRCETDKEKLCGPWSAFSSVWDSPNPPSALTLSLTNGNSLSATYTRSTTPTATTHYYQFKLVRSENASGTYADYGDIESTTLAASATASQSLGDVHTGYHYKAVGRRCSTATTDCGEWSSTSLLTAVNVPFTTRASRSVSSTLLSTEGDDITVNLSSGSSDGPSGQAADPEPTPDVSYHVAELRRAKTSSGTFTHYAFSNASASRVTFNDVDTGWYYKARVRACAAALRKLCGSWSDLSTALHVPIPDWPTLSAPTLSPSGEGLLRASFNLPSSAFNYVLTLESSQAEGQFRTSNSVSLDSASTTAHVFSNLKPASELLYRSSLKACEKGINGRCDQAVMSASTRLPLLAVGSLSPSGYELGMQTTVSITVNYIPSNMNFSVTSTGSKLRFNSCNDDPNDDVADGLTEVSDTVKRSPTGSDKITRSAFACDLGNASLVVRLKSGNVVFHSAVKTASLTKVKRPENVFANGHTAATSLKGDVAFRFDPITSPTVFEIDHAKIEGPQGNLKPEWGVDGITNTTVDPVNSGLNSALMSDTLELNKPYEVRIRTVRNGKESSWSESVYVFPTNARPENEEKVADIPLLGYLPSRVYSYTICEGMFPEDTRSAWVRDIETALKKWETSVKWTDSDDTNIIEVERAVPQSACLETGDRPWRGKTEIRYEDVIGDFEAACRGENGMYADACVYNPRIFRKTETTDPPPTRDPDPTELARLEGDHAPYMVINGTNTFSPGDLNGNLCSDAHALIVHEGGHVLGLEHRVGTSVQTVMTVPYSMTTGCVPTSYDVAAVMSIYQSLHVSTTETEESDE